MCRHVSYRGTRDRQRTGRRDADILRNFVPTRPRLRMSFESFTSPVWVSRSPVRHMDHLDHTYTPASLRSRFIVVLLSVHGMGR